ncbi:hypothetical protein F5880DRAFT_1590692 [Lentinula raphanica]|nr:hypothetical protein F5880DRAFT_1590692 [Lentinula raphanica]
MNSISILLTLSVTLLLASTIDIMAIPLPPKDIHVPHVPGPHPVRERVVRTYARRRRLHTEFEQFPRNNELFPDEFITICLHTEPPLLLALGRESEHDWVINHSSCDLSKANPSLFYLGTLSLGDLDLDDFIRHYTTGTLISTHPITAFAEPRDYILGAQDLVNAFRHHHLDNSQHPSHSGVVFIEERDGHARPPLDEYVSAMLHPEEYYRHQLTAEYETAWNVTRMLFDDVDIAVAR